MERMNKSLKKYLVVSIFSLPFASAVFAEGEDSEKLNYTPDDYRNFYGICWRGSPQDNIDYARQMGYTHVVYQWGMENCKNIDGLKYFLETPESGTANRTVDIRKKYTPEEIREFETTLALKDATKPFPQNIATGWFGPPYRLSGILDFQQKRIIDRTIDRIMERIDRMAAKAPGFKFAGIAWDVPQAEGDFWSEREGAPMNNGRQVTIKYWTGSGSASKHPDVVHDYPTHKLGHYEFYRKLFERCRKEKNPDSKFIVEPYNVYGGWIKDIEEDLLKTKGLEETKKYLPDFVCSEGSGTEFVEDPRVTKSGLYKKNQVSSSTPNVYDELNARKIAATAAINGAWTHWYGRPGATGNMPDYKTIRDVPARLKLSKVIPVWENINNTPLSERKWDGKTYSSPTAFMDKNGLGALQPQTQKFFFVFNSDKAKVPIPAGYDITAIYFTDGLFREFTNNEMNSFKPSMNKQFFLVKDGYVSPKNTSVTGQGFIASLKKASPSTEIEVK